MQEYRSPLIPQPSSLTFTGYATKDCTENGTWYVNEKGLEWSNYSTCGEVEAMKTRVYVHLVSYAISIALLLPAIAILFSYKLVC